jgi:hypothetical protein
MHLLFADPWVAVFRRVQMKDATIVLKTGSDSITVKIGKGDLTYTEKRNITYETDGGILDDVFEEDEVPIDVRFNFTWDYITGTSGTPSVEDVLKREGAAAAWASTDSDTCRPPATDIQITINKNCSGADGEVILLSDFRHDEIGHGLSAADINVTGRCNVTRATITRS